MRRTLGRIALALLLVMALDWAPGIPPDPFHGVAQVRGQVTIPIAAPNGTLVFSDASFSVANTAASIKIFKYIVSAGFIATSTAVPSTGAGTEIYTEARTNVPIAVARQPLKLMMIGNLRTAQGTGAAGTFDIGVSFGGTAASFALANAAALPGSCIDQPVTLEVWISPIATSTATPTTANRSVYVAGRFLAPGVSGQLCATSGSVATMTTLNGAVLGTTNLSSPTQLNIEWKFSSGSSTNVVDWMNRILTIGN